MVTTTALFLWQLIMPSRTAEVMSSTEYCQHAYKGLVDSGEAPSGGMGGPFL